MNGFARYALALLSLLWIGHVAEAQAVDSPAGLPAGTPSAPRVLPAVDETSLLAAEALDQMAVPQALPRPVTDIPPSAVAVPVAPAHEPVEAPVADVAAPGTAQPTPEPVELEGDKVPEPAASVEPTPESVRSPTAVAPRLPTPTGVLPGDPSASAAPSSTEPTPTAPSDTALRTQAPAPHRLAYPRPATRDPAGEPTIKPTRRTSQMLAQVSTTARAVTAPVTPMHEPVVPIAAPVVTPVPRLAVPARGRAPAREHVATSAAPRREPVSRHVLAVPSSFKRALSALAKKSSTGVAVVATLVALLILAIPRRLLRRIRAADTPCPGVLVVRALERPG